MDRAELDLALATAFSGDEEARRVVVRQALDLADAERLKADRGAPLTVDVVCAELRDAPEGDVVERWNWWMGSLEVAYGGYERFSVRRVG